MLMIGKMKMTINHYHVRIMDEKNRINELIEENVYNVYDVPHIDLNEFVEQLVREVVNHTLTGIDSGLPVEQYVLAQFGIN